MDLWIRSQDKTRLTKVNDLYVVGYDDDDWAIDGYHTNSVDDFDLGIYKFKERALEVLDEIQSKIATLNFQNHFIGTDFNIIESNIYQMPEE